jgi:hypothetical protein
MASTRAKLPAPNAASHEPSVPPAVAAELGRIRAAARRAQRRLRLGRALGVLPTALLIAFGAVAVTLAARKLWPEQIPNRTAWSVLIGAAVSVVLAFGAAVARRLPPHAGSLALDRHHGLQGRLTNALEFASSARPSASPLAALAVEDSLRFAATLAPRRAVPIRWPSGLGLALLCGVALAGLALLFVPRATSVPALVPMMAIDALVLPPDDVAAMREALDELKRTEHSPEVQAAIDRFNALVDDIANRRLNREEAFRRMEEIERQLNQGAEADAMALEEALKETAEELRKAELAEPVAKALDKGELDQAEKDLKQLAESLRRDSKKKPDKAQLDRLREALARAAEKRKEALDTVNERRAELRKDLLKKKQQPDGGAPDPQEQSLLDKKKRELERLDREAERREQASRSLSKLDRDLAKAAQDLLRDLGMSADDLERAAEELNRLDQQQMSEQEKEELRQRLEELRELIRQQGQGGAKRMARMLKFGQRARGGQQQGQGRQRGDGQEQGDGQPKPGSGAGEDKMLVIGPGGQPIPMPGSGSGPSVQGDSQGQPKEGDSNGQPGGDGIGKDPGGNPEGKQATNPNMSTEDVQAEGLESGKGPTNAEVILAAADRGFRGGAYGRVYRDYKTVAEDQIEKEDIPDGFRFYVRRYFQLIRPRE